MKSKNIHNLISYSEGGVLSKVVMKDEKSDVTLFCMAKGTAISEHTSTREGFVFVIEGKGIFNLEGNDIVMMSGIFIPLKKNAVHSLKAEENSAFLLVLND